MRVIVASCTHNNRQTSRLTHICEMRKMEDLSGIKASQPHLTYMCGMRGMCEMKKGKRKENKNEQSNEISNHKTP